ncbi:hypothetical protein LZ30DRAFT_205864 [Colletotrichum cereale]|nr:hypothetical protein LZ30DRAFT_205864 [Colletotrichum cereale]
MHGRLVDCYVSFEALLFIHHCVITNTSETHIGQERTQSPSETRKDHRELEKNGMAGKRSAVLHSQDSPPLPLPTPFTYSLSSQLHCSPKPSSPAPPVVSPRCETFLGVPILLLRAFVPSCLRACSFVPQYIMNPVPWHAALPSVPTVRNFVLNGRCHHACFLCPACRKFNLSNSGQIVSTGHASPVGEGHLRNYTIP